MARRKLTAVSYVIIDGQAIPAEELTEEQRELWKRNAMRRLSESMSDYYTQHPEEYERL